MKKLAGLTLTVAGMLTASVVFAAEDRVAVAAEGPVAFPAEGAVPFATEGAVPFATRGSTLYAQEGPALYAQAPLQPVPDSVSAQGAVSAQAAAAYDEGPGVGAVPVPAQSVAIPLFSCVKYKDQRKIAPCAVPMIVMVKDPCAKCDPCNPCAAVPCVAVQICVPPCSACPPKVTCRRGGEYVKYDFGKYRVEIRSKKGVVKVDYDA